MLMKSLDETAAAPEVPVIAATAFEASAPVEATIDPGTLGAPVQKGPSFVQTLSWKLPQP